MRFDLSELSPSERVFQLAIAGWMSQAVSVAAALGVADELASGPRSVNDIAKAVGAHAPTLYRLLRTCADVELFQEVDGQVFALTEYGAALRSDVPGSVRNTAIWIGLPAESHPWAELAKSVRTGKAVFEDVHGCSFWDYLRDHPEMSDIFDRSQTDISYQLIPSIVNSYDFSHFDKIVDIAGGQGALLAAVLAANPHARGVLYDQPNVIAGAGRPLDEAGVGNRCELVGGDFFESVPVGGDACLLLNVIHNWDDDCAERILANCRAAIADNGRVLVVEEVMSDKIEPSPTVKLLDLNMLLLFGGRQRSEAEFGELFQRVGLKLSRNVSAGSYSILEAIRV